ncbi:DUF3299 domain-containing protein [Chitinimonas sp. BJB300]|uniref:DUF3299 domain-containing protein n=1 Tax=Chitinimonas sp. BJB300 TaxID=1559339 RepID=UPI0035B55BF4
MAYPTCRLRLCISPASASRECLLVPYFGTCNSFPPPANQIVHALDMKPSKGLRATGFGELIAQCTRNARTPTGVSQ